MAGNDVKREAEPWSDYRRDCNEDVGDRVAGSLRLDTRAF